MKANYNHDVSVEPIDEKCLFCGAGLEGHLGVGNVYYILCGECGAVVSFRGAEPKSKALEAYRKAGT
ncbi:hypothetical protein LJC60_01035 [Ruminococcaceae bacterium OttesenSCG-928-D13]|nr:hypothetical protein [Ruminococcaceae bacterium OttesenSCG-928-D13]